MNQLKVGQTVELNRKSLTKTDAYFLYKMMYGFKHPRLLDENLTKDLLNMQGVITKVRSHQSDDACAIQVEWKIDNTTKSIHHYTFDLFVVSGIAS